MMIFSFFSSFVFIFPQLCCWPERDAQKWFLTFSLCVLQQFLVVALNVYFSAAIYFNIFAQIKVFISTIYYTKKNIRQIIYNILWEHMKSSCSLEFLWFRAFLRCHFTLSVSVYYTYRSEFIFWRHNYFRNWRTFIF